MVQVRKLKAENGSRGGQRPPQKPALPSASRLGGPPLRSRMGARGWLPRFRDARPPPPTAPAGRPQLALRWGSRRPPRIPWWGSVPWALGAEPGLCSVQGPLLAPSQGGLWALHGCGPESVHHSAGVREESRCSRGARGGPSGGLTKPPPLLASPGGLGTGNTSPGGLATFHSFGKVTC